MKSEWEHEESAYPELHQQVLRHRMSDARWRSNVASCYTLLKEVVLQKHTWDPENVMPQRLSKIRIINEVGKYIQRLEEIISSSQQPFGENEVRSQDMSLEKIRSDFSMLESFKYVNVRDVGPFVQQYLNLLAMEEMANVEVLSVKHLESVEKEVEGNMIVFNPKTGESLWRVPNIKHKSRQKNIKRSRPIIVNVGKSTAPCLATPRCSRTIDSPHELPAISNKNFKATGCGRHGVKRRLLEEMNSMDDYTSSQASSLEDIPFRDLGPYEFNNASEQSVPEPVSTFPKIPQEAPEVPCMNWTIELASEIEVTTTNTSRKGKHRQTSDHQSGCDKGVKGRKGKSQQVVPLNPAYMSRKRRILASLSDNVPQHGGCQEVPSALAGTPRHTSSALPDFTALKNSLDTSLTPSRFVSFGPAFGLSPPNPESLLTTNDPLLNSASSGQLNSPDIIEEKPCITQLVNLKPTWTSPSEFMDREGEDLGNLFIL